MRYEGDVLAPVEAALEQFVDEKTRRAGSETGEDFSFEPPGQIRTGSRGRELELREMSAQIRHLEASLLQRLPSQGHLTNRLGEEIRLEIKLPLLGLALMLRAAPPALARQATRRR
jgi:hypothetical protein